MFEKFQDDIEKLIVTKERLTASITETETELMKQKRLQYEVNDVIECKKLDCEDMKKQLMLLKRNEVEHQNIIDPLKSTLDETKITLADVSICVGGLFILYCYYFNALIEHGKCIYG